MPIIAGWCVAWPPAGRKGLGPLDVLVLHSVNHRGRAKTLSDICLVLNIEDTHTVTYALKKAGKGRADRFRAPGQGKKRRKSRARAKRPAWSTGVFGKRLLVEPMKALGLDESELSRDWPRPCVLSPVTTIRAAQRRGSDVSR